MSRAPPPIIRRASTARRKDCSRSTRFAPADRLVGLDFAPLHARLEAYQVGEPQDLRGPVLLAALALLALDALVVFLLAGGIGQILRKRPQRAAAALVLAVCWPR